MNLLNIKIKLFSLFIFCFIFKLLHGQYCLDYYISPDNDCYYDIDRSYSIYNQSLSALLVKDSTKIIDIVFYGKREYKISFCTEKNFYPIRIKLINTDTGKELYNNFDNLASNGLEIELENTMIIRFEVTLLGEKIVNPVYYDEIISCTGILIQWTKLEKK